MTFATLVVPVLILGGIGLTFAGLIAVTHRRFWVWVDPHIDAVVDLLPGTNCGACGQPGCQAFAEALVAGSVQPATCTVMSSDGVEDIAHFLGVEAGEAHKQVARLLCAGGCDVAPDQAEYRGLQTCKAAAAVAGGGKGCAWGCLGLADCEVVCDLDAIFMNPVGLPVVVPERCTACNDCVEACPKDLFVLMPVEQKLIVQCRNALDGDLAEAHCAVACTACGKCALDAAPGLIAMLDGLAVVDYNKNDVASPDATIRCPTGAIVWVEGAQTFERTGPAERVLA